MSAEEAIARIFILHGPYPEPGYDHLCAECNKTWPCATSTLATLVKMQEKLT